MRRLGSGLCRSNGHTAVAPPFAFFTAKPENAEPYTAILPAKEIIAQVNGQTAYRAQDSQRLLNLYREESEPDEELNDILWHAVKGVSAPKPPIRYSLRLNPTTDDD